LSPADITALERAVAAEGAAGGRYPEMQLRHMDSEQTV
jgi:hypothetical protein